LPFPISIPSGDYVADFRLIDYLVALLSTPRSGALDSHVRVKGDLAETSVFDTTMPMYLLYRQRLAARDGFCGFEGRYYSLFHHLGNDFAKAADLQQPITILAYQYILSGRICHTDIPDDPSLLQYQCCCGHGDALFQEPAGGYHFCGHLHRL
jgi:hypothetical protein